MAIIGNIDGVPVFDKKEEALVWGKRNDLTGHHTHTISGKTGYMGGDDHSQAIKAITKQTPGNGTDDVHPCKDPLWMNLPLGTPSNLQKIDYCNRCATQPGTNGNPVLGNFPVNIIGGFWSYWQGGTNYCSCCYGVIESAPPTTTTTTPTRGGRGGGY